MMADGRLADNGLTFDVIRWLTFRFDGLILSVSSRCAVVLSANAVLTAALVFTIDKYSSLATDIPRASMVTIGVALAVTLLLLTCSMYFATTGIVTTWGASRRLIGPNPPQRPFFHTTDTFEAYASFAAFRVAFCQTSQPSLEEYALGELWTVMKVNHVRYLKLKHATQLIVLSLPTFVVSIGGIAFYVFQRSWMAG